MLPAAQSHVPSEQQLLHVPGPRLPFLPTTSSVLCIVTWRWCSETKPKQDQGAHIRYVTS